MSSMRRVATACLLVLVACGRATSATTSPTSGSSTGGPSGPTSSPTTVTSSSTTTAPPATVGRIEGIGDPAIFLDEEKAGAGDPIVARQVARTDGTGQADISLVRKVQVCRLFSDSSVRVAPTADVLLELDTGSILVFTTNGPASGVVKDETGAAVTAADPLFLMSATSDRTTVDVAQGFVQLASAGASVVVGPDQTSSVVGGGQPETPTTFSVESLPPDQSAAIGEFSAAVPPPDFSRPDADDSATLQRMFGVGSIMVATDSEQAHDRSSLDFAESYLGFLAGSWDLGPQSTSLTPEEAGPALSEGKIDAFVSPVASPQGASSMPLFEDGSGRTWFLSTPPGDDAFLGAMQAFLIQALQSGVYGDLYRKSFGTDPAYGLFASLLGLGSE